MTPIIAVTLLALLWTTAAVFWLLDAPSPRQTVELLLDSPRAADDQVSPA